MSQKMRLSRLPLAYHGRVVHSLQLAQKLGQRVCHLALKPKIKALGGSWPLEDGYFTCNDDRSIPETISMVSGLSVSGEAFPSRPLKPRVVWPLGFILQTGHLTYGPYADDQDLYQIWLETRAGGKNHPCAIQVQSPFHWRVLAKFLGKVHFLGGGRDTDIE